jgi:hypothetical protein
VNPVPFPAAWSEADTAELRALMAAHGMKEEGAPEDRQGRRALEEKFNALTAAIDGHVLHLATTRPEGLSMPPHSDHVEGNWLSEWRSAAAWGAADSKKDDEDEEEPERLGMLGRVVFPAFHRLVWQAILPPEGQEPKAAEVLHQELVKTVETGNFHFRDVEDDYCFNSGHSLKLWFKNWEPGYVVRRLDPYRLNHLAEGDILAPRLHHATIDFPSGKLLAFDACRSRAFREVMDELEQGLPSINSVAGRVERSTFLAGLGIASAFVGNTSTVLRLDEQGIRAGWTSIPDETSQDLGTVCNDMWWTSVVDRQTLVGLFAKNPKVTDPEAAVSEWLKEHGAHVVQATVEPGTYHLYFAGDPSVFEKHFNMEEVGFDRFREPYFALSKSELTPRSRPALKMG